MQREPAYQIQRNCFWIAVRLPTVEGRRERAELFVLWWDRGRGDFAVESLQGHIHQGEDRSCVLICGFTLSHLDDRPEELADLGTPVLVFKFTNPAPISSQAPTLSWGDRTRPGLVIEGIQPFPSSRDWRADYRGTSFVVDDSFPLNRRQGLLDQRHDVSTVGLTHGLALQGFSRDVDEAGCIRVQWPSGTIVALVGGFQEAIYTRITVRMVGTCKPVFRFQSCQCSINELIHTKVCCFADSLAFQSFEGQADEAGQMRSGSIVVVQTKHCIEELIHRGTPVRVLLHIPLDRLCKFGPGLLVSPAYLPAVNLCFQTFHTDLETDDYDRQKQNLGVGSILEENVNERCHLGNEIGEERVGRITRNACLQIFHHAPPRG